jgi:hypothetical protein
VIWRLFYAVKRRFGLLQRKTPIQHWEDIPAPDINGTFFSSSTGSGPAIASADEILSKGCGDGPTQPIIIISKLLFRRAENTIYIAFFRVKNIDIGAIHGTGDKE